MLAKSLSRIHVVEHIIYTQNLFHFLKKPSAKSNVLLLGNKPHFNYLILLKKILFNGTKPAEEINWQIKTDKKVNKQYYHHNFEQYPSLDGIDLILKQFIAEFG